jgi:hypothetical protein
MPSVVAPKHTNLRVLYLLACAAIGEVLLKGKAQLLVLASSDLFLFILQISFTFLTKQGT